MSGTSIKQVAASNLSLPPDTYIYQLARLEDAYAAISSDDSLTYFDSRSLVVTQKISKAHDGVTCLVSEWRSKTAVTAGRDGIVRCWDVRGKGLAFEMHEPRGAGLTALAVNGNYIAAGTESTKEGLGDVNVLIWDTRNHSKPLRNYAESHNDTITQLEFGSHQSHVALLSAATDGLVSIFNSEIEDEDDALMQVFNHHAAVHCAGFMSSFKTEIYAVSSDEQLSIYTLDQQGYPEDYNPPVYEFGDVREKLGCSYVVGIVPGSNLPGYMAIGDTATHSLRLVPMIPPKWDFDPNGAAINLIGAHGDEIVRDILVDAQDSRILTCGEDGHVRAWATAEQIEELEEAMDTSSLDSSKKRRRKNKSKGKEEKARFAPY